MDEHVRASGRFELTAWQDARASLSLATVDNTRDAFEQLLDAVSRNVSLAYGGPGSGPKSRVFDVLALASKRLSERLALLGAEELTLLANEASGDSAYGYRISTTKIVRGSETGVLIRLVETSGKLILEPGIIERCLTIIAADLRAAIRETLGAHPLPVSAGEFEVAFRREPEAAIDVVRVAVPDDDAGPGRQAGAGFRRARLQLASGKGRDTEATVLFRFEDP